MPEKKPTLNRFPLFGLFAYRAARHMGYPKEDARLLGYSTALLYAIFKPTCRSWQPSRSRNGKTHPVISISWCYPAA